MEPTADVKNEWYMAQVAATIINMNVASRSNRVEVKDLLLKFKDPNAEPEQVKVSSREAAEKALSGLLAMSEAAKAGKL